MTRSSWGPSTSSAKLRISRLRIGTLFLSGEVAAASASSIHASTSFSLSSQCRSAGELAHGVILVLEGGRWFHGGSRRVQTEGCIEVAWIMGYFKHFDGRLADGSHSRQRYAYNGSGEFVWSWEEWLLNIIPACLQTMDVQKYRFLSVFYLLVDSSFCRCRAAYL